MLFYHITVIRAARRSSFQTASQSALARFFWVLSILLVPGTEDVIGMNAA